MGESRQGEQREVHSKSTQSHSGEFGLYPVGNREGSKWKDLKWRPVMIRFAFGGDPSGFISENVGKKSQLETGSPS